MVRTTSSSAWRSSSFSGNSLRLSLREKMIVSEVLDAVHKPPKPRKIGSGEARLLLRAMRAGSTVLCVGGERHILGRHTFPANFLRGGRVSPKADVRLLRIGVPAGWEPSGKYARAMKVLFPKS